MTAENGKDALSNQVTEDEAALYDRQIRLWGLEAQGRIRGAHILVLNLDGLTTEAIKDWVLAGIHRLTLIDFRTVTHPYDLSAGFFWREEDVGKDRLSSAAARIQALNPLVHIDVLPTTALHQLFESSSNDELLERLKPDVLVLGLPSGPESHSTTWWTKKSVGALNRKARSLHIKFYCAGAQGFDGWLFSDLGDVHEYVIEKPELDATRPTPNVERATGDSSSAAASAPPPPPSSSKRLEKRRQKFVPLDVALNMTWKGMPRSQLRRQKPSLGLFAVWSAWSFAGTAGEESRVPSAESLSQTCNELFVQHGVEPSALLAAAASYSDEDRSAYFTALNTAISVPGQFSPSCAILGGVLAQDVLNAIGGREEPLVNWFQLDGLTGAGLVHALSISPAEVSVNV